MTPLPVEQALSIILEATPVLPAVEVGFDEAAGRFLQEEVRADHDSPRFDKATMDGYAVRAADLDRTPRTLRVLQEIPAGSDPGGLQRLMPGTASRIMTGAPVPPGADAVLMVEESEPIPGDPGAVRVRGVVGPGENIARRGEDVQAGDLLLSPGEFIGPGEIGVLASCGRVRVRVGGRPRVAVLSTGDELVPPEQTPAAGRIRNSNGPTLAALARRAGAEVTDLGMAADTPALLRERLLRGLEADLLITSGGVSMGARDIVAETLESVGVAIRFTRVAIKPGKPFTFGTLGARLVFASPGNPVSSYVMFQVFARAAIRRMAGCREPLPAVVRGRLEAPVRQRAGRTGYYQALARFSGDGYAVSILPTSGSADFVSCARGNALALVPAEVASLPAGAWIDLILLDDHADR
jgi:molybdopterin molybdotransferase